MNRMLKQFSWKDRIRIMAVGIKMMLMLRRELIITCAIIKSALENEVSCHWVLYESESGDVLADAKLYPNMSGDSLAESLFDEVNR